jgi:hypothetical protein
MESVITEESNDFEAPRKPDSSISPIAQAALADIAQGTVKRRNMADSIKKRQEQRQLEQQQLLQQQEQANEQPKQPQESTQQPQPELFAQQVTSLAQSQQKPQQPHQLLQLQQQAPQQTSQQLEPETASAPRVQGHKSRIQRLSPSNDNDTNSTAASTGAETTNQKPDLPSMNLFFFQTPTAFTCTDRFDPVSTPPIEIHVQVFLRNRQQIVLECPESRRQRLCM